MLYLFLELKFDNHAVGKCCLMMLPCLSSCTVEQTGSKDAMRSASVHAIMAPATW